MLPVSVIGAGSSGIVQMVQVERSAHLYALKRIAKTKALGSDDSYARVRGR